MRRDPDRMVVAWLAAQPPEAIWTTAITVFEIRFGLEILWLDYLDVTELS